MAAYNKFQDFVDQLCRGVHNFGSHTLKVMLTNTAPVATNTVKADLTEITAANGYTAGGASITASFAEAAGTGTLTGTKVVFTAAGGTIGPLRYVALYNDTPTSPIDPLIGWWDYGSSITLNDGETFSVKFNNSDTTGTVLTVA